MLGVQQFAKIKAHTTKKIGITTTKVSCGFGHFLGWIPRLEWVNWANAMLSVFEAIQNVNLDQFTN